MSDYVELMLDFFSNEDSGLAENNLTNFLNSEFGKKHFGLRPKDVLPNLQLHTGFGARTWPEVYKEFVSNKTVFGYKLYKQATSWQLVE